MSIISSFYLRRAPKSGKDATTLYLRGTGYDRMAASLVQVNGVDLLSNQSSRGLHIVTINRDTLEKVDERNFDTYGNKYEQLKTDYASISDIVSYLNSLDDSVFVCMVTFDAVYWPNLYSNMLECIGCTPIDISTERTPFACVGIKGLTPGYAIQIQSSVGSSAPYAELSTYIANRMFVSSKTNDDPLVILTDSPSIIVTANSSGVATGISGISTIKGRFGNIMVSIQMFDGTATKFHFDGSSNYASLTDMDNGFTLTGGNLKISVSDNGDGLSVGATPVSETAPCSPGMLIADLVINYHNVTYARTISIPIIINRKGDTGHDGLEGKDGVGIISTTITYQIGDSGTIAPTGTWSSSVPTSIAGKFLWTKMVWSYTDNTTETGYSVSKYGEKGDTGISGCQVRTTEWELGKEYRNDTDITDTSAVRYLDYVTVTSSTSYTAYLCKKTHTSSAAIGVNNTTYWTAVNIMAPISTPFISVQQALAKYIQANQLVVTDNNVVQGAFGGGGDYLFWAGGTNVDNATFKVHKNGSSVQNNADIRGTISERYSFVERGTFNKIDFSTVNNIAVNRGILNSGGGFETPPSIVALPLYEEYAGGNFNTTAYTKAGTNVSIQNSYNPNIKNWTDAELLINGSEKAHLRYQLAASAVFIVSDPRIIAYNNYLDTVPLVYPNGAGNVNDSIEYRKGRMVCNGKPARIAMILPGQTLRLQSAIETYNGTSYLVWYVVNASEYASINKGMQIIGNGYIFGSDAPGAIAFSAINTYSGWGTESGGHETDFLIAPKELDAEIIAGYDSEDPSIVVDCSDPALAPSVSVTERQVNG